MGSVVGVFEAKTKLSELLARVVRGESFTITNRRKPVAKIGPLEPQKKQTEAK